MARALVLPVIVVLLLSACSEAEIDRRLDEIAASAQRAYDDLATAVDDLVDGLDDEARAAVEEARATAEEARAALEDFAADPNEETRRALRDAEARAEDARGRLESITVPGGLSDAFEQVVDSLEALRQEIRRALDQG